MDGSWSWWLPLFCLFTLSASASGDKSLVLKEFNFALRQPKAFEVNETKEDAVESLLEASRFDFGQRECKTSYTLTSFIEIGSLASNENCTIIVTRPSDSICKLNINFYNFDGAQACSDQDSAFLIVAEKEQLCGNLTGSSQEVDFDNDVAVLTVVNRKNDSFFYNFTVRQIDCGSNTVDISVPLLVDETPETASSSPLEGFDCNRFYKSPEFVIQSPNYPFNYPNNVECVITVLPTNNDICSLELRFDEFRVEPSPVLDQCANDYLEISDDNPLSTPMRYCGFSTGIRLIEMGDFKRFTFKTNSNVTDIGYSIFVRQISCEFPFPEDPSVTSTTSRPTITSPTPRTTTTPAPTRPTFVPDRTTPATRPTTSRPDNPFLTSTTPRPRPDVCSRTYLASPPVLINSPNFPAPYSNNELCSYYIQFTRSDICFLQITFLSFNVEDSPDCEKDYLLVNGVKLCGTLAGTYLYPIDEPSVVELFFTSDFEGQAPGFEIQVSQMQCDELPRPTTTSRPTFFPPVSTARPTLSPPFTPRPTFYPTFAPLPTYSPPKFPPPRPTYYPPIYIPSTARPTYHPSTFQPPPQRPTYQPPNQSRPTLPPFQPPAQRPTFHPPTQRPTYQPPAQRPTFHPPTQRPSYQPPVQRPTFHPSTQRPSYQPPVNRPPPERPSYHPPPPHHHQRPRYRQRQPKFLSNLIEAKKRFWQRLFSIFRKPRRPSGPVRYQPPHQSYASPLARLATVRVSESNHATNQVVPNDETMANIIGFEPSNNNLPILTCGHATGDPKVTLISPGYPDNYDNNLDCSYTIHSGPDVCGLQLQMHDFILEESADCQDDFLQVNGGDRLCSQQSGANLFLPVTESGYWTLDLHSDSRGATRGFRLTATQISCDSSIVHHTEPELKPCQTLVLAQDQEQLLGFDLDHVCKIELAKEAGACSVEFELKHIGFGEECLLEQHLKINDVPFCFSPDITSFHDIQLQGEDQVHILLSFPPHIPRTWSIAYKKRACGFSP